MLQNNAGIKRRGLSSIEKVASKININMRAKWRVKIVAIPHVCIYRDVHNWPEPANRVKMQPTRKAPFKAVRLNRGSSAVEPYNGLATVP